MDPQLAIVTVNTMSWPSSASPSLMESVARATLSISPSPVASRITAFWAELAIKSTNSFSVGSVKS